LFVARAIEGRHRLVPVLMTGNIVVTDNLGVRKVASVREPIEAAGASLVYLLAYSADLNPFELDFWKLSTDRSLERGQ
jgi:hypothetical protein